MGINGYIHDTIETSYGSFIRWSIMLLQQLQNHLRNHGRVSLAELEHQMKIDAETLRRMLEKLIRKGRVCKVEGKACGGCHSCRPETIEFYEWISPQSMS